MNRWLRSFLGMIVTILAYASVVVAYQAHFGGGGARTVGELLRNAAFAFVTAIGAGYLAAALAGWRQVVHGVVAGAFVGWGMGSLLFDIKDLTTFLNQPLTLAALTPAGALGGRLRLKVIEGRRAEQERLGLAGLPLTLPVRLTANRPFQWLGVLASALMVAAALFLLRQDDSEATRAGTMGLLFFGPAGLFLLYRAVVSRPHTVLDGRGITFPMFGLAVPWSQVAGARIQRMMPVDLVVLEVNDLDRLLFSVTPWKRRLLEMNRRSVTAGGLPITAATTGVTPEALCDLILRHAGAPPEGR